MVVVSTGPSERVRDLCKAQEGEAGLAGSSEVGWLGFQGSGGETDKIDVSPRQDEGMRAKTRARRNFTFTKCDDGCAGGPGTWERWPRRLCGGMCVCAALVVYYGFQGLTLVLG